ncbi:transcriptional repressor [bacterium]|nr:transcriptional repressor [bacterium]
MTQGRAEKFTEMSLEALRDSGHRITKQRKVVIECLAAADEPLSAPEVYERLSREVEGAQVDRVSVYRALDTLLQLKLVHKVSPNGAYLGCTHQNCVHSHHIMSRCTGCDDVRELDVPNEVVAPLLFHMKNTLKFTPDPHVLHMDGLCDSCSAG